MVDKDIIAAIVLVVLLIFQQFLTRRKHSNDANRFERETNKLTKQTSETVNRCADKTAKIVSSNMEILVSISEYLEKNDIGRVSTELTKAIQMLEEMGKHQDICLSALDRVGNLVRSIADDIQQTNSELVHERIEGKLHLVEEMVRDVKNKLN